MKRAALLLAPWLLTSCEPGDYAFTLYRSSLVRDGTRIHIATFDASDGRDYNQTNCQIAADLFQAQPGVTVRYWCELGRFEK